MQRSGKSAVIAFILLITTIMGSLDTFGQKAGGGKATASNAAKPKSECKGNYTGIVTYNRTIKTTHSGRYGSNYTRTYNFQSSVIITDNGLTNGSIMADGMGGITGSFNFTGKGTANMNETVNDLQVSEKDDFCKLTLKGAQGKTRVHCESLFQRQGQATGTEDVNVYLGFKGSKYSVSVSHPKTNGTGSDSSKSSCKGTCGKDQPINSSREYQIKNEKPGNSDYTDDMPLNPASTNRLSGTFTRTSGDETMTITWNLARCAPPLRIESLDFEHHQVPDATRWYGVDSLGGTVDGNVVKIKAKVFNAGGDTAYATVKFKEMKSNEALPDGSVSVAVKPGEAREVEYEWDTNGYAWDDFQKALSQREIMAEVDGDAMSAPIKIYPKPVVMAHGLWSNAGAWSDYPGYLREAHSFAWKGFAVGSDAEHGKMDTGDHPGYYGPTNTVFQNAQELAKQIKWVRQQENAWHIDIVAHSMGGLISRKYIDTFMLPVFDGKPEVKHLIMLGTPNMGSPCADLVGDVFEFFDQNEMHAMRELRPSVVADFNRTTTNRKGVKFSILAGYLVPRTCQAAAQGDGVVIIRSALYNIDDKAFANRHHLDLTGEEDFKEFVMPRIAIGPRRSRADEQTAWLENDADSNAFSFRSVAFNGVAPAGDEREAPTTKQKVALASGQLKEIDIPVNDGNFTGVVMAASPGVTATLIDAGGAVAGKSEGGMAAMKEMFRTISVSKQVTKGTWKLKLENIGNRSETVYVAGFGGSGGGASLVLEVRKSAQGASAPIVARWTENGLPVTAGKVTAVLNKTAAKIDLFDDGQHGDGAADDGVYGGVLGKLAAGEHYVEAKGEAAGFSREAMLVFSIAGTGAAKPVARPAAKPVRKGK